MKFGLFILPCYRAGVAPTLGQFYEELTELVRFADRSGWDRAWQRFTVGLEESLGQSSGYFDGLSFGQDDLKIPRAIASDRYPTVQITDEPGDGIIFSDGTMRPGGQAVFDMIITDNSPKPEFYLIQRQHVPVALTPTSDGLQALAARVGR